MEHVDVSFACSAFLELAKAERMRSGVCLTAVTNGDILANLEAAAVLSEQPLALWCSSTEHRFVGPEPSVGLREVLTYVGVARKTYTRQVASVLHLTIPNASNKLRQLWREG